MRTIYHIAKTELQTLFYSPIAWMILVIFVFQASLIFTGIFEDSVRMQDLLGQGAYAITSVLFTREQSLLVRLLSSLYLYIPLLTMGLMSREYNSGSIKLLYNAPIRNRQIILGKYLSMLVYGLLLVALLAVFVIFAGIYIPHFDWGVCFSGLLGIYLLICVYSAIGLFMSSITSYQLVAAISTLSLLAVLNYIGRMWQNIDFVRDLTYWLSMSGRAQKFISGLICSEDVLYFLILITLFLSWTIIQLQATRQKSRWYITWSKFLSLFAIVMLLGYLTSRPKFMVFYDATQTKSMSLVPESQQVMKQLKGGMTMTTYGNILADDFGYVGSRHINEDLDVFESYFRYKPEIETEYVYYYPKDADPEELKFAIDYRDENPRKVLSSDQLDFPIDSVAEGMGIVRVFKRENGQQVILPDFYDNDKYPREEDMMMLFRRFLMDVPQVGYVTGLGERSFDIRGDRSWRMLLREKTFRSSLVNGGLDPVEIDLQQEVPAPVKVLVLADIRQNMKPVQRQNLQQYIDRGGNLLIAIEPRRSKDIEEVLANLGVQIVPGCLVFPNDEMAADILPAASIEESADRLAPGMLQNLMKWETYIAAPTGVGLDYSVDKGYKVVPLFKTSAAGVWNEVESTNFVDDTLILNPKAGEVEKSYPVALALSRQAGEKEQKILVYGNADYFSNAGLDFLADRNIVNMNVATASFHWLTDGFTPIEIHRPLLPDEDIRMSRKTAKWSTIFFMGFYPGLLILLALFLSFRRRGK